MNINSSLNKIGQVIDIVTSPHIPTIPETMEIIETIADISFAVDIATFGAEILIGE